MAAPSRHSASPSRPPRRPSAPPVGTSEAAAWWSQLRASVPRGWRAAAAVLALALAGLLYWSIHA
jgi:hypothetical protein